jgi:nucleotide-binding universal stress UspA family protein
MSTSTFRKILVPIDFSEHSRHAVQVAAELAKACGASLTLLHAYVIPAYALPEGFVFASAQAVAELMQQSQDALDRMKLVALAAGATQVELLLAEGAAFTEIVRVAAEKQHDLIVMGTHGRTGLAHAFLGSVAEKVVRRAPCAVLTVRLPGAVVATAETV